MISRVLFDVLLFLLPFALYALYLRLRERDEEAPSRQHPWTALFVSGLLLVVASFVVWGLTDGSPDRGVYVPPHLEDGRLVPGQIVLPEPGSAKPGRAETERVETGGPR